MEFDKMDPVFNPQITKLPEGFTEKAQKEISAGMGFTSCPTSKIDSPKLLMHTM